MTHGLFVYNARLLDESIDGPGAVLVIEGKIRGVFQGYFTNESTVKSLADSILKEDGCEDCSLVYYDARGLTVTPSFIDMHVHFRYPGQTQKEDLDSGLHAAIAGGFGTVVTMPNTNPVVSSAQMAFKIDVEASSFGLAKVIQTVSITKDFEGTDIDHLDELDSKLVPVVTEDGHDVASAAVMLEGMSKLGAKGIVVSCHCEDNELAKMARPYRQNALNLMEKYHLPAWGCSSSDEDDIPDEVFDEIDNYLTRANDILALAEDTATARNISIAKLAGCHVHLAHVSTANAIESIRNAKNALAGEYADFADDEADAAYEAALDGHKFVPTKKNFDGFNVTCEVTPHHIALCGTDEPNIRALVNPPLRSEDDRIAILDALRDGTVDVIATDHAPHTLDDKAKGAPGFTGIETAYGVCNTVLVQEGQIDSKRLSQLMSANPAKILKLNKGLLKPGFDADITIVDPEETWIVEPKLFCSKGKATPFDGRTLTGRVKTVFIAGNKVFES
ncbi:MAG: dihydroorotase [Treponema sp.]|nr:dihydroorotase [Treponema sp.]